MPFKKGESGNPKTQFQAGQSGNPAGKPKGSIHLSTHIQTLLADEDFVPDNIPDYKGGSPMKAIIATAITKAVQGDNKWAEWLAKYGYGEKYTVDQNISGELTTGKIDPALGEEFAQFLKNK